MVPDKKACELAREYRASSLGYTRSTAQSGNTERIKIKMSKKDYELIARSLRDSKAPANVVEHMARTLGAAHRGHYAFKHDTFIEAATARESTA